MGEVGALCRLDADRVWSWNFVAPGWDKDTPARLLGDAALADRKNPPGYALDVRRSYCELGQLSPRTWCPR